MKTLLTLTILTLMTWGCGSKQTTKDKKLPVTKLKKRKLLSLGRLRTFQQYEIQPNSLPTYDKVLTLKLMKTQFKKRRRKLRPSKR
jgi:ABC-type branched-subunit amino acid transport system ATPase component